MPKFIVRIVLHGVKEDADVYEDLHAKMEKQKYFRWIKGSNGKFYKLPPATYQAKGSEWTAEMIREEVKKIANDTGYKNSVLVTESVRSVWIDLDEWG